MEERGEGEEASDAKKKVDDQQPAPDQLAATSAICDNMSSKSSTTSQQPPPVLVDGDNLSLEGVAIRRPRSDSKKRNYRRIDPTTTASSDDEEPKSTSSRLDVDEAVNIFTTDVEKNADKPKDETSASSSLLPPGPSSSSTNSAAENKIDTKTTTDSKPRDDDDDDDDHMSTSSSNMHVLEGSSTLPHGPISPEGRGDSSSSSSSSSSDPADFPPRLAYYPGGVEMEDSNTSSSSSSSLEFLQDEDELEDDEDDSSDSSDSLDDLEDRPATAAVGSNSNTTSNNQSTAEGSTTTTTKNRLGNKSKNPKDQSQIPKVLSKPKAKCEWNAPKAILERAIGYRSCIQVQGAQVFRSKFYGSLFSAERLELAKKLDGHDGCVNCLSFNYAGTKLASGSDDLEIKIWNYAVGKLLTSFNSKHRSNVFQAKFMPLIGLDNIIVSCARDSQVRLTELDSSGGVAAARKLAQHRGPVHKLAINPETPHIVLSCGEDGVVMSCDIREDQSQKILSLVEGGRKVPLYSIHCNPLVSHEFCVSGRDEYVRIYDTRKLSRSSIPQQTSANNSTSQSQPEGSSSGLGTASENDTTLPFKRFCPHHLQGHQSKPHITAAVYNYNGSEIIASYNDENIYLFDNAHSDLADYINCYEGHLNSATVKGVNFFGDKSQFIITGSDCSHIFIFDKATESIVNFFRGDEKGVVNCLEPHPTAPILATSGLDDDIKIWIPSSESPPKMGELASTVKKNIRKRNVEIASRPNALDGQIMWQLINHLHREQRRHRRAAGEANDSESSSDDDDEELEGAESSSRGIDCVIA